MHHTCFEYKNVKSTTNHYNTMNVNQTKSAIPLNFTEKGKETLSSVSGSQRLSFENIRSFRQHFEQGTIPMRFALGDNQHQTLIVAMYEGTEKLLNQDVSEFAVLEYLEGLKLTAKELRQQGISGEQFRTSLLEHSASTVRDLVSSS